MLLISNFERKTNVPLSAWFATWREVHASPAAVKVVANLKILFFTVLNQNTGIQKIGEFWQLASATPVALLWDVSQPGLLLLNTTDFPSLPDIF